MNEPNPYSSPQSEVTNNPELYAPDTGSLVVKTLMWVVWIVLLFSECVLLLYAYRPQSEGSEWLLSFEWVMALLILLAISMSFRFLLIRKTRKLWLLLIAFLLGIFFANVIVVTGMFAMLTGQQTSMLLGVVAVLLYCPYWIKVARN